MPTRRGGHRCPPLDPRRQLGDAGEDLAAAALKKQGYKILERNYVCPLGEIDLIARQGKTYVFIEVKTRQNDRFGAPQEAVNAAKQRKLRLLADYYLKQKRLGEVEMRFDVVGITHGGGRASAGDYSECLLNNMWWAVPTVHIRSAGVDARPIGAPHLLNKNAFNWHSYTSSPRPSAIWRTSPSGPCGS